MRQGVIEHFNDLVVSLLRERAVLRDFAEQAEQVREEPAAVVDRVWLVERLDGRFLVRAMMRNARGDAAT